MPILICPSCNSRLTVSPAAPKRLTCPRCLAHLVNPNAGQPPPLPMRVLPLDDQVQRDTRVGNAGIIVVCVMLAVGLVYLVSATSILAGGRGTFGVAVGLMVAATMVGVGLIMWKPKRAATRSDPSARATAGESGLIDYRHPDDEDEPVTGIAYLGQAIGGIILGIAVAVVLTLAMQNSSLVLGAIIAPAAAGVGLYFIPRLRGLAMGLILAVPIAFLLLIGFCFAALAGASFH